MNNNDMPATEATSYELAFHVLPTVAEGEVTQVVDTIKNAITKAGGTLGDSESPERIDLAYDIEQYLEGRNRTFNSAYFGWLRFSVPKEELTKVTEVVEGQKELLRHLLIKLTAVDVEYPFFYHEAMAVEKSETIDLDESAELDTEQVATPENEDAAEKDVATPTDEVNETDEVEAK